MSVCATGMVLKDGAMVGFILDSGKITATTEKVRFGTARMNILLDSAMLSTEGSGAAAGGTAMAFSDSSSESTMALK